MSSIFTASSFTITNKGTFTVAGRATIANDIEEKWYELHLSQKDSLNKAWLEYDNGTLTYYTLDNTIASQSQLNKFHNEAKPGNYVELNGKQLFIAAQYYANVREASGDTDGTRVASRYLVIEAIDAGTPLSLEFSANEWEVFVGERIGFDLITLTASL